MKIIGGPDNQRPDKRSLTVLFCDKIKNNEMGETIRKNRMDRGVYRAFVSKPEGKKTLGKPRRRWKDNIKMDLSGSGMCGYGLDRAGSG